MMRRSPASSPRPGCPHRRLRNLLLRELPPGLEPGASTFRPWASANFVGARHIFPCVLATGSQENMHRRILRELAAVEWALPGHIVADMAVEYAPERHLLRIEILTVED